MPELPAFPVAALNKTIAPNGGYKLDGLGGWTYLHIKGDARARGWQHGWLLHGQIGRILKNLRYLTYFNNGQSWDYFIDSAAKLWASRMDNELLEEMQGIAEGATEAGTPVSWQEILAWNGYMELVDYWWPSLPASSQGSANLGAPSRCSAFLAKGSRTADGRIVLAHNSWDNFETGQFWNVILDLQPSQGYRMLMQTAPGLVHSSTDFFVTGAGIVGSETTMGGFNVYDASGLPEFVRIRRAMQYGATLDDYIQQLTDQNSGGYANSWLFGDINRNDILRLELGLKYWNIEANPACDYFIGFNAAYDPRIRNLECSNSGFADIRRHQGARQVRLADLMDLYNHKIDNSIAKTILADKYDVYLQKENHPCSRTVDGHYWLDAREYMNQPGRPLPFQPRGTYDGKTVDSTLAEAMTFDARWGNSSGIPFNAEAFLNEHRQWDYLRGYLDSRPSQDWQRFSSDLTDSDAQ